MVKKRLIACLLWNNGVIVQSINFKHTNAVGNALTAVDFFNMWAIDEIVLLDVTRGETQRDEFYRTVEELSKRCFVPLSVGGKITTIEEIRTLLSKGADKVVINTYAVNSPQFITKAANIFGSQCIVISIDSKINDNGEDEVYLNQGKVPTGLNTVEWAKKAEKLGCGEIFLTSVDHDGSRSGYNLKLIKTVSNAVKIPVIASGGVGEWHHLPPAINAGAEAVSAANIFHYTEQSTKIAKDFLKNSGIDVRRPFFYQITAQRKPQYKV